MPLSQAAIAARMLTAGLPTLPTTVAKLENLIGAGDVPIQVITDVIAADPAISALVIGQANASGHNTTSLADAIRHNGLGVVLSTARCAIPVEAHNRPVLVACWAQANLVSALVPIIADHRRYHLKRTWDAETLRVCGLAHDLTHVLVLTHFPEVYQAAAARCDSGQGELATMLESELGLGMAALAGMACTGWHLPPILSTVIAHWRRPSAAPEHAELCAIVHLAHMLAVAIGFPAGADRFVAPIDPWVDQLLQVRVAEFEVLTAQAFAAADDLAL